MKGNRIWAFGAVAGMLVVLIVGWFLGVSPKLAEADAANSQRTGVEQQNTLFESQLVELRDQNERLSELEDSLADLQVSIPASPQVDSFIDDIYAAATASGLLLTSVTVSEPGEWGSEAELDAPNPDTAAEVVPLPEPPPGTYTVAVSVEAKGTVAQFLVFTDLVQTGKRLMLAPNMVYVGETAIGVLSGFIFVIPETIPESAGVQPPDQPAEATPAPTETPAP